MKWHPVALMALVLGLGLWLAIGPASRPRFPIREGAIAVDLRIADTRGALEQWHDPASGNTVYRVFMKGKPPGREYSAEEVRELFGDDVIDRAGLMEGNFLFQMLNITSWVGVVWVGIGLGGQLAFSGRMLLQWFVSERKQESIITESFWWFSLVGAVALFSYFVWRQDPVGILGQASGIVVYARNIRLIHKKKRRDRGEASESHPGASERVSEAENLSPPEAHLAVGGA